MAIVGNLAIGMFADSSGFTKGLKKGAQDVGTFTAAVGKAQSVLSGVNFGSVFAGLSASFDLSSIGSGLKGIASSGADLNATISKTKVIFGESASTIFKDADEMAVKFGVVKTQFIEAAGSFGAVFEGAGKSKDEAAALGSQVAKLALDMGSLEGANVTTEQAFDAISSAMRGEMDPLEKFRVYLTADKVASEALAMGLAKSKDGIDDLAKQTATLNLIFKGTKAAQGDLARTAGEADNQFKALGGRVENLKADLGMAFQPATEAAARFVNTGLSVIGDMVTSNLGAIKEWATGAGQAGGVIESAFAGIGNAVGVVVDGFQLAGAAWQVLQGTITGAVSVVTQAIMIQIKPLTMLLDMLPGIDGAISRTANTFVEEMNRMSLENFSKAGDMLKNLPGGQVRGFFDQVAGKANAAAQSMGAAGDSGKKLGIDTQKGAGDAAVAAGKLDAKVKELEKDLNAQITMFGKSSGQLKVYELAVAGASAEQIKNLHSLTDMADAMKAFEDAKTPVEQFADKMKELNRLFAEGALNQEQFDKISKHMKLDVAKDVIESTLTPLDKYKEKMKELTALQAAGAITGDQFAKASKLAMGEYQEKEHGGQRFAGAMEMGSAEARSAVLNYMGADQSSPDKPQKELVKKATEQVNLLSDISTGIARLVQGGVSSVGQALEAYGFQ